MFFRNSELLWQFGQLPNSYNLVDAESTGLFDEQGAPGLVSVGICFVESGIIIDKEEFLVRPHREMEPEATNVNGFTQDDVDSHPEFSAQWSKISEYFNESLVITHNALFDWKLILDNVERYSLEPPTPTGVFCSQRSSQTWAEFQGITTSGRGPSLDKLTKYLDLQSQRALNQDIHSALIDAIQTVDVVETLRSIALNKYGS